MHPLIPPRMNAIIHLEHSWSFQGGMDESWRGRKILCVGVAMLVTMTLPQPVHGQGHGGGGGHGGHHGGHWAADLEAAADSGFSADSESGGALGTATRLCLSSVRGGSSRPR